MTAEIVVRITYIGTVKGNGVKIFEKSHDH